MKPFIIFVDDEPRLIDSYKRELEFSFDVKFISEVDELLKFIEIKSQKIDLLILDAMIPSGSNQTMHSVNTEKGMKTGLILYEIIREIYPFLPIIIFTNFTRDKRNKITQKIMDDDNAKFFQKEDYLPFELANEIEEILKNV